MLAGPILTPIVFLEDKAFSAKWPALPGGPDFGRGLFLFRHLVGASNQSPSAAQQSPAGGLNPPEFVTWINKKKRPGPEPRRFGQGRRLKLPLCGRRTCYCFRAKREQ